MELAFLDRTSPQKILLHFVYFLTSGERNIQTLGIIRNNGSTRGLNNSLLTSKGEEIGLPGPEFLPCFIQNELEIRHFKRIILNRKIKIAPKGGDRLNRQHGRNKITEAWV